LFFFFPFIFFVYFFLFMVCYARLVINYFGKKNTWNKIFDKVLYFILSFIFLLVIILHHLI
jgi:hypothetical protein